MDNQQQELIQKLRDANNVLVTVSANPSVDQLAACIGMTLFLNKLGKHATAVFSGQVPSTLEFLKPEETLEKNTDSLRDFIVSLDKAKADKLRYKVEDNVVKIFITPYKTSITEADLNFSQGDFNIDVVICLGVEKQQDLDQAITSHGRILHDATVMSISIGNASELGTLNWVEPRASSLSELAAQIADAIGRDQVDGQIATAFLTGIVAETDRFSNEKTSPVTMQLSAQLMSAGANQQLVATELQANAEPTLSIAAPQPDTADPDITKATDDGTLEIGHNSPADNPDEGSDEQPPMDQPDQPEPPQDGSGSDDQPSPNDEPQPNDNTDQTPADQPPAGPGNPTDQSDQLPTSRMVLQPPSLGGQLTANSAPESFDPSVDPLTLLNTDAPMLNRPYDPTDNGAVPPTPAAGEPVVAALPTEPDTNVALPNVAPTDELRISEPPLELPVEPSTDALSDFEPLPSEPTPPTFDTTAEEKSLAQLEEAVDSPHLHANDPIPNDVPAPEPSLDAARDAVLDAVNSAPPTSPLPPTQSVGAEGYLNVQDIPDTTTDVAMPADPIAASNITIPTADPTPPTSVAEPASTAPPVPPPLPLDPTQFAPPK